jgi:two-component system, chemotaxis family, sensor kinase CheA
MDDLLAEFTTETNENLATLDQEMVKFEQNPNDAEILKSIFRTMHTIKGTCGFLGLGRLERLGHAGEDLLVKFRDGELAVTPAAVSLILTCLDQIKVIVGVIETTGAEPAGADTELINQLKAMANGQAVPLKANAGIEQVAIDALNALSGEISAQIEGASNVPLSDVGFPVAKELLEEVANSQFAPATSPEGFPVAQDMLLEVAAAQTSTASARAKDNVVTLPTSRETPVVAPAATPAAPNRTPTETIRVNVEVVETLMNLVSEMVLGRNQLLQLSRNHDGSPFKDPIVRISRVTTELQEAVMKTRMQPIGNAWNKLPRLVRDLALELGKKINLDMHGEETELDRQVLELIRDPLTHMVRNSGDHGLERPDDRAAAGKAETGTIKLSAFHEGGHIIIQIADDGRGLNTEKIKVKIVEKGLATATEVAAMSDHEIHQYILKPGFSTAEKITNVSGRGVGMDVVRSNIEKIGGTLEFRSEFGKGSTFTMKIPLTLAIISALIVECGGQRYAIPQIAVSEVVRAKKTSGHCIEMISGAPVLRLRNRLLPLVDMRAELNLGGRDHQQSLTGHIVVARNGAQTFGIVVDHIADAEEVVVKPLSRALKSTTLYSGNTVLGDGNVILIMDINGLSAKLNRDAARLDVIEDASDARKNVESILMFRSEGEGLKAIALGDVHRIEKFSMENTEVVQGKVVIQYRGDLMPIYALENANSIKRAGTQTVLVFKGEHGFAGLAVTAIVDLVQDAVAITRPSRKLGIVGSGVVATKAVDFINPEHFLAMLGQELSTNPSLTLVGEAA